MGRSKLRKDRQGHKDTHCRAGFLTSLFPSLAVPASMAAIGPISSTNNCEQPGKNYEGTTKPENGKESTSNRQTKAFEMYAGSGVPSNGNWLKVIRE
ncbi:hypothetical protein HOY80DRAFT_112221 [Tuber brumale]|nr:hypothetical protein HOY80DRAFT_112221 [Tuber brumale]